MMEQTFIVCVKVASHDVDILDSVPSVIRERFRGTAVRVIECEPERPWPVRIGLDFGDGG